MKKLLDCFMDLEKGCQRNLITTLPSSSASMKQRSLYMSGQNFDNFSCNGCHRNSAGSSSSRGSSSGFESMKSGSSHVCSATGSNSSFLRSSFTVCGSSSGMWLNSSQSRLSMQSSSSSGDASLITNNIANVSDDSGAELVHGDNLEDISRLSFSDMLHKGISVHLSSILQEAEILALWLGNLGYPEYLPAFLTQGYDLWTIARITPEDLTALGITHPTHRKFLISEIHKWHVTDSWPTLVPSRELRDWLPLIGLSEYIAVFEEQGYCRIDEIQNFMWEDFEDIGIKKLGHLKRLGLAIKKIKDHEFGRIQSNNDLQQLAAATYFGLRPHQTLPPPAPTSTFRPSSLDTSCDNYYSTERQRLHIREVLSAESHAQEQVCPLCQSTAANETVSFHLQECDEQSLESGLNKQKTSSLQMNLCSLSRILSDDSFQKHSVVPQQLAVLPAKILSTADNSISSDSEDYPPPPAPLVCEGSIQLLRSAFNESAMAATAESSTANGSNLGDYYNEVNSFSLNEQLSFANDNCGTIKSRDGLSAGRKCIEGSTNTSFSQPNTPHSSYSISASNGDVLNDIGSMLQNLTDELDAMLSSSQSIRYSPDRQIPF
uniref:Caskin-1 n=1 Tax=Elaeophora elaphi TaxID=1147741 RepID=A0A0R3S215_9BILA